MTIPLTTENTLWVDDFSKAKEVDELTAVAIRLNNLILMDQGTMPNDPKMGVGIRKYKFEYANTETIYKLRNDILEQMEMYLPIERNYDINVYIEIDPDSLDNKKVIYVKFDIMYKNNEIKTFIIAYKNPENSGRLVAEIRI